SWSAVRQRMHLRQLRSPPDSCVLARASRALDVLPRCAEQSLAADPPTRRTGVSWPETSISQVSRVPIESQQIESLAKSLRSRFFLECAPIWFIGRSGA